MPKKVDLERRAEIGRERRARTRAKIIAAAFDLFGDENGLYSRIEDIADRAGVTRPTFYNHFSGMEDLREAVTLEATHGFLGSVIATISQLDDPRHRAAGLVRFFLHRAREDGRWAWSVINMSANGVIFGSEAHAQADRTVREGMEAGVLRLPESRVGRDIILGGTLSAIATLRREEVGEDYPEAVAGYVLMGLGVPYDEARAVAHLPLPPREVAE